MKSKNSPLKILTRPSQLALKQVEEVTRLLPSGLKTEVVGIKSYGDKNKDISLFTNARTDIFTKELDEALIKGKGDIAVHSAKDLPYPIPAGLEIIALLPAEDKTDSLVSRGGVKLKNLPRGAKVGTSSIVRKDQLLRARPDIKIVSVRGTIEERIRLVDEGKIDALIVATCALKRLGLEKRIAQRLPFATHPLQGNVAMAAKEGRDDLKELFANFDIRKKYGRVYLAGFGPGDPKLLTFRAHEVLKEADVIYYDYLISADFLARYKGEKIFVGKIKGNHSSTQDDINEALYQSAVSGKTVVRLKTGDPFIFGRGGEEMRYLKERLVEVEIVPGITSAIAAGAYSEIPLTQREIASTLAFCTGHPIEKIAVPNADTVVYYMSADVVKTVAKKAIEKGWSPDTPAALVFRVSFPEQEVRITTLGGLLKEKRSDLSHVILIIGKTAALGNVRSWFMKKKKVLVTGTQPERYRHLGEVIHQPMIELKQLEDNRGIDSAIEKISGYHWIMFTSKYAVQFFFLRLGQLGKDARNLSKSKIVSIGNVTTAELALRGIVPDLQASDESSTGLIRLFKEKGIAGKKILIPRSDMARERLVNELEAMGNSVDPVIVYRNAMPEGIEKIDLSKIDTIVFASPSGVKNFRKIYGAIPKHVKCVVRGEETAKEFKNEKAQIVS